MVKDRLTQELQSSLSPDECWTVVTNVQALTRSVDIVHELIELVPLERYRAVLADDIGPFQLRAPLDIRVLESIPSRLIRFRAEGDDRAAGTHLVVKAAMTISESDQSTSILLEADYTVAGRVAALGSTMVHRRANVAFQQLLAYLRREFL